MDIYKAISDFIPPETGCSQNILQFAKGDRFEVFECDEQTDWWGARSLKDNSIGYVPRKYLQYEERKMGKLVTEDQEKTMKHFADQQTMNPDDMYPEIPEPDYVNDDDDDGDDDDDDDDCNPIDEYPAPLPYILHDNTGSPPDPVSTSVDEEMLIKPRKLSNPCLESKERQALHKELLYNYKLGKNILQKTELNKVLEKRKESQRIREWDQQKTTNKRTSLEMKLEERAAKVEQAESMKSIEEDTESQAAPEFIKIHRRITVKSKSENVN